MSYNRCTLVGQVGGDPEINTFQNGAKKAKFSLATSEKFKAQDGTEKELTEWHTIECWRGLANLADQYIRKGMKVMVVGSIHYREIDSKNSNGKMRYTNIVADSIELMQRPASAPTQSSPTLAQPQQVVNDIPQDADQLPF